MKADRHRHRFRAHVEHLRPHFQDAIAQRVGHVDRVGERPLLHPRRLAEELEAAGHPGRARVCRRFDDLPPIRVLEKAVNRNRPTHVSQLAVECVFPAVRVERGLIEAIGERRQERNAGKASLLLELLGRGVRPVEDIVAPDLHLEADVTRAWSDRHRRLGERVPQLDDPFGLTHRIALLTRDICRCGV